MLRFFMVALMCCLFGGCATVNNMAFDKNATTLDTSAKSVLLVAVDISRSDDSRYTLRPLGARLEKPNAQSAEERQTYRLAKDVDAIEQDGHTIFLARMAIAPGQYKFTEIYGMASAFPFNGIFGVPVWSDVTVAPNSVTYLGHVTAKLRPRQDGEFRAGPPIPLIDQAATGFSGGTWDVTIDDQADKDLALFRANFPVLSKVNVDSKPLPSFDRAAYQRYWDGQQAPEQKEDKKVSANVSPKADKAQ